MDNDTQETELSENEEPESDEEESFISLIGFGMRVGDRKTNGWSTPVGVCSN